MKHVKNREDREKPPWALDGGFLISFLFRKLLEPGQADPDRR